jgi:5'-nucleotidase
MADPKKVALFDLDGTLVDLEKALNAELVKLVAPGELPFIRTTLDEDGPEHIKNRRRLIFSQSGFWRNLPRFRLGWTVLEITKILGFESHILTHGPVKSPNAWSEKLEWCSRELPGEPVTVTRDKSLVYGRVLVDDWPPYIIPWLKSRPRGLVIMPAHAYNEGFTHPRVIRYTGFNTLEVSIALEKAYERK